MKKGPRYGGTVRPWDRPSIPARRAALGPVGSLLVWLKLFALHAALRVTIWSRADTPARTLCMPCRGAVEEPTSTNAARCTWNICLVRSPAALPRTIHRFDGSCWRPNRARETPARDVQTQKRLGATADVMQLRNAVCHCTVYLCFAHLPFGGRRVRSYASLCQQIPHSNPGTHRGQLCSFTMHHTASDVEVWVLNCMWAWGGWARWGMSEIGVIFVHSRPRTRLHIAVGETAQSGTHLS